MSEDWKDEEMVEDRVAHNVSLEEDASTPKKRNQNGPSFAASEFGPMDAAPRVQQSALVTQQKQQKKQMTRAEHAKLLRESKRAAFEEKRE